MNQAIFPSQGSASSSSTESALGPYRPFHNGFDLSPGMFNGLFTSPGRGKAARPPSIVAFSSSSQQTLGSNVLPGTGAPSVYNPSEGRDRLIALANSMAQTPIPAGGFPQGQHPLQSPAVEALPLQQRVFLQNQFFNEQTRLAQQNAQQRKAIHQEQQIRAEKAKRRQAIAVGEKYKAKKALEEEIARLRLNLT